MPLTCVKSPGALVVARGTAVHFPVPFKYVVTTLLNFGQSPWTNVEVLR
jgi:hypothetical protein